MPIAETALIIKGATVIAHWMAAHGTSAMATKAGLVVAKYAGTHGIASTLTALGTTVTSASLVVGGVLWTTERLQIVGQIVEAICKDNRTTMITKSARLALMLDLDFDLLPNAIEQLLIKQAHFSYEDASQIADLIHSYEKEIKGQMNRSY